MSATDVAVENLLDESQWSGKIYSDGWVEGPTQIETTEPATGEVLGTAGGGDAASIARAAASAAEAQRAWAATPFAERAAVVQRAAELMEKHRAELIHWLIRESGAIPPKADHEISASIGQLETAAALTSEPLEVELPSMTPGRTSTARRAPLGVVGVITPWNFPYVLAMRSLGGALALGNAVVLKPDANTPVTGGVVIARLFEEAGLPEGVLHVIPGAGDVGQALVEDPHVRMISFTGSTATGRLVGETAGRMLKRTLLEMGGNSPLVVLEDADIEAASSAGAWGSFLHQGQICLSVSRHLVHESIVDDYTKALAERAGHLPVGNPATDEVALGPIINEKQLARVRRIVDESVEQGAKVIVGGTNDGLFFTPTVLGDVTPDDAGLRRGDLRPRGAGDLVPRRRRGGRARQRDRVRAERRGAIRLGRARVRGRRPAPGGDGPHQRPDRERGAARAVRRNRLLEQRRPLRRGREPRALDGVAVAHVPREGGAVPVLS